MFSLFKKKEELKLDDALDIPPLPPIGFDDKEAGTEAILEEELPAMPKMEKLEDLPPLPDIYESVPDLKEPEELPDIPVETDTFPEPAFTSPKEKVQIKSVQKQTVPSAKYMRMDAAQVIASEVSQIRANLRLFEEVLTVYENRKEDVMYDSFVNKVNDINVKLKSVDRRLFGG